MSKNVTIFSPFWGRFWLPNGAQEPPKTTPKNDQKNDAKKDVTLEALGRGNLGELRTESAAWISFLNEAEL